MNLSSKYAKIAFVVGMVVIIAAFALVVPGSPTQNPPPAPQSTATGTVSAATTTATSTMNNNGSPASQPTSMNATGLKPATAPTPKSAAPGISFVTPVSSDFWTIASQNLISWNRAGNVSGELTLSNAQTKKVVGVILNEVGPQQTSYTWNTRDLLVSRSSPAKITVPPGTYFITLSYDGNNITPANSPAFNIVQ